GTIRACSRCRTVAYCCELCQCEDWNRVHRFECRALADQNQGFKRDGFRLTRVVPDNFYFISRHFVPLCDQVMSQMSPHQSELKKGEMIYTDHDVEHPGTNFEIVTVEEYRQEAAGLTHWSPARFDAVLKFVHSHHDSDARLVSFVVPCWDQRLHTLCVVMEDCKSVAALAQIEYRE
ncbi:hypothetical protein BKA70DRAFT_365909, partial [Coprinopsis sp. MPI-PUGE-AT-0042]